MYRNLKAEIARRGISRKELATVIGCTEGTISMKMNEKSSFTIAQDGFRWMDYNTDWWMTLAPGDNVLRLTADEGRENMTVTITAPKGVASNV